MLVHLQTGCLDCRGYQQWKEVGRHVRRGAGDAHILAPRMVTVKDENGDKRQLLRGFLQVPVFAVTDTDGKPLPQVDYTPRRGFLRLPRWSTDWE